MRSLRPVAAVLIASAAAAADVTPPPFGFSAATFERQRAIEALLQQLPDPARCEAHHRHLTREPHPAGSDAAGRVAEYVAAQFGEAGLATQVITDNVLLSWPRRVDVEMTAPQQVRLGRREDPRPEDPDSAHPDISVPWHAYSASGVVEAEVVYVNHGRAEDYEALAALGIEVRGKIALARYFGGYRGGKSIEAEKRGVLALITYSDPAEDGYVQGDVYPKGPWGPDDHVQRGANVYDFIVPGDPLTPGWPSTIGAKRIPEAESEILPKIPSLPLSFRDARVILEALGGPVRPTREWQGGGPFAYHVGPGPASLKLTIDVPREQRPIRNVIARLAGGDPNTEVARQVVLISNHHDAWTFGGVDPSSGTATVLELARAFGELVKQGYRPRRSIVFGVWDAEEFTLTGSTEWGEANRGALARDAVACLNLDSATQGDTLTVGAVPSMRRFAYEAARAVADPKGRGSLYDVWRATGGGRTTGGYGVEVGDSGEDPPVLILGSGSDYTVFFNHIGVPSLDMTFAGPYGVYHSAFDSHEWMQRHGDPGFRYHATMARLLGVMALRLANADVLPFDYAVYGRDVLLYLDDVEARAASLGVPLDLSAPRAAAGALATAIVHQASDDVVGDALTSRGLMGVERALLNEAGLPGRPWFKHLIYAPLPSYAAETLPGIREAVEAGDAARAAEQALVLTAALQEAVRRLAEAGPAGPAAEP